MSYTCYSCGDDSGSSQLCGFCVRDSNIMGRNIMKLRPKPPPINAVYIEAAIYFVGKFHSVDEVIKWVDNKIKLSKAPPNTRTAFYFDESGRLMHIKLY